MHILHTEASPGWGGQEHRILAEAEGMRARGHTLFFAVQRGGMLAAHLRAKGFLVYEYPFRKAYLPYLFYHLCLLIRRHRIDIVNTHSSVDAWVGGLVGKLMGCRVIRTRHLSTHIRKGWNSLLLYNRLADYVVTTCAATRETVCLQASLPASRCFSIPTGVDIANISIESVCDEAASFRKERGISQGECLVGTLCVLRGWKGVSDLLQAAYLLREQKEIKWVIVGSGVGEEILRQQWKEQGLEDRVIFAGFHSPPFAALAAMDIFTLLSWGHEGVSQASLQAAWLAKPLVTTPTGGLCEVCVERETGLLVPIRDPQSVARAIMQLAYDRPLCQQLGQNAHDLVRERFTLAHMLDQMEALYRV